MTTLDLLDLDPIRSALPELREKYATAGPFPHIVLDGVLTEDAFARAVAEFPPLRDERWKGYLHINETKYANTEPDTWGPTLTAVARELVSEPFVALLAELTGIDGLLPDWSMDGGGLHQTLRGGHLNIHADFTTHHDHANWQRRVNILLYLNERWDHSWGGQLELWDTDMSGCQVRVEPAPNRMLVFTTSFDSYHGHPDPLTCPDDVARRSMALYYFTQEKVRPERRATNYRARPDDGIKRVAIWADRRALDVYDRLKRRLHLSDANVSGVLERVNRVRRKRR